MSNRPTLVMVPGLLCDADLWAHQRQYLADVADVVVADVTHDDSLQGMARAVLDVAPDRFSLVGLSMGGYVAHAVMAMAPQRVERLALLDTSAVADSPEASARRRALIELGSSGQFSGVIDKLLPVLVHADRLQDEALVARIRRMADAVGPEAFVRQQTAILSRPDRRSQLVNYGLPTLVLCGRQDAITPLVLHEEMTAAIPGARLAIVEECGHLSTMERPFAVTALLRDWMLYDR